MDIAQIIVKSIIKSLTTEENTALHKWLETPRNRRLYERLSNVKTFDRYRHLRTTLGQEKEKVWNEIREELEAGKADTAIPQQKFRFGWIKIAALLLLSLGLMIYIQQNHFSSLVTDKNTAPASIEPGSERALLVLSDGKAIDLEMETGHPINIENTHTIRNDYGVLSYQDVPSNSEEEVPFSWHELNVPIGGRYQIILQDGTKVWLNSTSKLRYPTSFVHHDREVFLEGEAFFEVVKNQKKPFVVQTAGENAAIIARGTSFNVKAYTDRNYVAATLIEGKIQVHTKKDQRLIDLSPGQQAILTMDGNYQRKENVNVKKYIAWKDGIFLFDDEPLDSIIKRLSRWYNFKLVIENKNVSNRRFTGAAYFNEPLQHIIEHINKTTDVHITIDKDTLYVR